jgi:hypothetical protein
MICSSPQRFFFRPMRAFLCLAGMVVLCFYYAILRSSSKALIILNNSEPWVSVRNRRHNPAHHPGSRSRLNSRMAPNPPPSCAHPLATVATIVPDSAPHHAPSCAHHPAIVSEDCDIVADDTNIVADDRAIVADDTDAILDNLGITGQDALDAEAARGPYPLWEPARNRAKRAARAERAALATSSQKRHYYRDLAGECLILRDEFGMMRLPIADLPGRLLTLAMLEGLATLLQRHANPRTTWLAWRNGLYPSRRRKQLPPPKKLRPLTIRQEAIVAALLDHEGCEATYQQAEAMVRGLTPQELRLWVQEPDVILHVRRLSGQPALRTTTLLDKFKT